MRWEGPGIVSFVVLTIVLAWKGVATPRPAPEGAERAAEIRVRASAWTHAFCAFLAAASLLLAGGILVQRSGGLLVTSSIAILFFCLGVWMWWDVSQTFVIGAQSLRILRPGCRERTLPFSALTRLDVPAPTFIVDARFSDGTRITFLPCLYDADEGARRVLVGAPLPVVDAIEGPGRDAVRALRERNDGVCSDGGT